nr:Chain A, GLY-ARG-ALA-THR-LYS-SER-ILE-PRO-PRO-ARG-ALA-PHE-PRO-ASP [Helianthus annuus]
GRATKSIPPRAFPD